MIYHHGWVTFRSGLKGSDGSTIEGVIINDNIHFHAINSEITNILIRRCTVIKTVYFKQTIGTVVVQSSVNRANNIVIKDCILANGIDGAKADRNILIANNIIAGTITSFYGSGVHFENNVIHECTIHLSEAELTSNIFQNPSFSSGSRNLNLKNNVFDMTTLEIQGSTFIDNVYGANFNNQFINVDGNRFTYDFDYHLAPESGARGAGINGTDAGIYGGTSPYKEGAVPRNPHIAYKYISPVTDANGNLKIDIIVEAQKN